MRQRWLTRAAVILLLTSSDLLSSTGLSGEPAIVFEPGVVQYRQAVNGVKEALPTALEVDPEAPDAALKLTEASLIIAVGRKALTFARGHAPLQPIVFCMVLGVATSDLSKGITGVPLEPSARAVLSDLLAISPSFLRVGFVYNPKNTEVLASEASLAAKALGVTLIATPVGGPAELKTAVSQLGDINALWLPPDPKLFSREVFSLLLSLSAERHVPLIGFLDSLTQAGALASVSPNYADNGVRAGKLAAEILARPEGRRTPVPPPVFAPGNLTINLQTARALGVEVSAKAIAAASQVIR